MTILIDLGTSRTGVAFLGDRQEWLTLPNPVVSRRRVGTASWGIMDDFIKGGVNISFRKEPRPHLLSFSRYARFGSDSEFIIPFHSNVQVVPGGIQVVPDSTSGMPFTSIKQEKQLAEPFLRSLARLVAAYDGGGSQWVIGSSTGGIDPRKALPISGTDCFNEAVAVVFALVSLNIGNLREEHGDRFLLLADLGGGFLDVSLAHDLKFAEDAGEAAVVNYGGYPLGVDRVSARFSTDEVQGPHPLIDMIGLAIAYHLWDYAQRPGSKTEGMIVLTGGGFSRLDRQVVERRIKGKLKSFSQQLGALSDTRLHFVSLDTKYLTLVGLGRLAGLSGASRQVWDEGAGGEDIAQRDPAYHGQLFAPDPCTDSTWYALLDSMRAASY